MSLASRTDDDGLRRWGGSVGRTGALARANRRQLGRRPLGRASLRGDEPGGHLAREKATLHGRVILQEAPCSFDIDRERSHADRIAPSHVAKLVHRSRVNGDAALLKVRKEMAVQQQGRLLSQRQPVHPARPTPEEGDRPGRDDLCADARISSVRGGRIRRRRIAPTPLLADPPARRTGLRASHPAGSALARPVVIRSRRDSLT